ncbi:MULTISPECIES: hypothetical protein [Dickeya]|uniref:Uncharacterized protein n=1 Tax=Dickeya lacustris TaxID=2259638 RepID=A0ABY8G5H0_9GAMM|nr:MULTISPECIES: hypothetical protein [Dickeya]WFN55201.1 hypothetical protein O1Q98_16495 [Dickeya lacustris]WJM86489.1 hypothetical protein QUF31_05065 [Dickeya chrysanthemi]
MNGNNESFKQKAAIFSQITSVEEKCEYVYELLEDICRIEDGSATYSEEHDCYQFFSSGDCCSMRLVMSPYGDIEHFEFGCN